MNVLRLRTRSLAAAVLAGILAAAAGAQTADPARKNAWTQPHVLRYATSEDVVGLNIHFTRQVTLRNLTSMTMAALVRSNHENQYGPELATAVPTRANGGISADGKTFTYHLRRDAKWSDGAPFTADDVLFTTHAVLDPAVNEQDRTGFDKIARIESPDPYTVLVRLKEPFADFAGTFYSSGSVPVLPKHLLKDVADLNRAEYNALPVGIGPFKYKSWRRGDAIELVADPLYFRGRPKLDRVIFKIIPDRNTTLAQLQTHEIDLWTLVPGAYLDRVQAIPGIALTRVQGFAYNHIDFNVQHPAVADPIVRRALRLAIDRATILQKINHGVGILSEVPLPKSHPGYPAHPVPLIPFDIAQANKLLDDAGWKRGADGVRAKNGVRLALSVGTVTGAEDTDQQIELIRTWWKEIGVTFDVGHYATALWFGPIQSGGIIQSGKHDVVFYAWSLDPFGDLSNTFGCDAVPPKGQNSMRYCNRAVDAAWKSYVTEYDPQKRKLLADTIYRTILTDVPTIVTSIRENIFAYNSDFHGFMPNSVYPFDNMMTMDI